MSGIVTVSWKPDRREFYAETDEEIWGFLMDLSEDELRTVSVSTLDGGMEVSGVDMVEVLSEVFGDE